MGSMFFWDEDAKRLVRIEECLEKVETSVEDYPHNAKKISLDVCRVSHNIDVMSAKLDNLMCLLNEINEKIKCVRREL